MTFDTIIDGSSFGWSDWLGVSDYEGGALGVKKLWSNSGFLVWKTYSANFKRCLTLAVFKMHY